MNKTKKIIESKSIKDIFRFCSYNSFIIFDIDNTIAEAKELIGSDQCFSFLLKSLSCSLTTEKAKELSIAVNMLIQSLSHIQPVEQNTLSVIKTLQDINIPVLLVTARGPELLERTFEQLSLAGFNFNNYWTKKWENKNLVLSNGGQEKNILYKNGILFCDGFDKGKSLTAFLKHIQYTPKNIVMMDDKEYNLHSVKQNVNQNTDFYGIRYGYLDEKVKSFNPQDVIADLQILINNLPKNQTKLLTESGKWKPCLFTQPQSLTAETTCALTLTL